MCGDFTRGEVVVKVYLETLPFRWWNLRSSDAGGDPQHISQLIQLMARLGFWAVVKRKHTGRAAFVYGLYYYATCFDS